MLRYGDSPRRVTAPCCGRSVSEDMLISTAGVPEQHRPRGADYACDACRFALFARNRVTPLAFFQGAGASTETLQQMGLLP